MPYFGHKSVTLTEVQVKKMEEIYYTDIKKYRALGLTSFSKFMQYVIDKGTQKMIEEGQLPPQP